MQMFAKALLPGCISCSFTCSASAHYRAVNENLISTRLKENSGLQDSEDDVRAVSADALLPVANLLASQDQVTIAPLTSALWNALLDVDELSPSTGD